MKLCSLLLASLLFCESIYASIFIWSILRFALKLFFSENLNLSSPLILLVSISPVNPAKVAPPFLKTMLLEIFVFLNLVSDKFPKSKESQFPNDYIFSLIKFVLPLNTLKLSTNSPLKLISVLPGNIAWAFCKIYLSLFFFISITISLTG